MDDSFVLIDLIDLKPQKKVHFGDVTTYRFPRAQGHVTVPARTSGASSLGMGSKHISSTVRSVDHQYNIRTSIACTNAIQKHRRGAIYLRMDHVRSMQRFIDFVRENACRPLPDNQDTGFENLEVLVAKYCLLQPLTEAQREWTLMQSDLAIDFTDRKTCQDIRNSRAHTGCYCKGQCFADTCPCRKADVSCDKRVCKGCTKDSCGNEMDRWERDAAAVQKYRRSTLRRMQRSDEDQGWILV